jgi:hypothetical protein
LPEKENRAKENIAREIETMNHGIFVYQIHLGFNIEIPHMGQFKPVIKHYPFCNMTYIAI